MYYSAVDVNAAREALNVARRKIGQFFQNHDLLLSPTITQLFVPLGTIDLNHDTGIENWEYGTAQFNDFTHLGNATGLPAISLPLCQSSTGVPIG
jgi:amidase